MTKTKFQKLVLDDHGSYLGMEKGCFIVKDKHDKIPCHRGPGLCGYEFDPTADISIRL